MEGDLRHRALPHNRGAPQDGKLRIFRVGIPAGAHTDIRMSTAYQEMQNTSVHRPMPARNLGTTWCVRAHTHAQQTQTHTQIFERACAHTHPLALSPSFPLAPTPISLPVIAFVALTIVLTFGLEGTGGDSRLFPAKAAWPAPSHMRLPICGLGRVATVAVKSNLYSKVPPSISSITKYMPTSEMHLLPLQGYPDVGMFLTVAATSPLYVTFTLASKSPCERYIRQTTAVALDEHCGAQRASWAKGTH